MSSIRVCAFDELGCGKSLSILYELLRWREKHKGGRIYSNVPLRLEHVPISNPEIIFDIEDGSSVFLDELWTIADSRRSSSIVNDIMCALLIKSRKSGWFVGYTQQHWRQTDLRIRYITEVWVEPKMKGKYCKMTYYSKEGNFLAERVFDGSKIWNLYDSSAIPYTMNVDKLKTLWQKKNERF